MSSNVNQVNGSRQQTTARAAIVHAAGYAGGTLASLLLNHPSADLVFLGSRSQEGLRVADQHARLRGISDLTFMNPDAVLDAQPDVIFLAGEHGAGFDLTSKLLTEGFSGIIIDLSADFRLQDPDEYPAYYGIDHPNPDLLSRFQYGLADLYPDAISRSRLIANPGCFASGLSLSLAPLARLMRGSSFTGTVLTGASGSGSRAKATTHFPDRFGNVRAYSPFTHRHTAEARQVTGGSVRINWVPASGPWTHGIWGVLQSRLPAGIESGAVTEAFESAYGPQSLVRLSAGRLPELLPVVGSPFIDIGWIVHENELAVGFALDNLWKGAASQAVQNMNLALGWADHYGLLPGALQQNLATVPHQS